MTSWVTSLIAVGGTLAGAATTNLLQTRVNRAQRREALQEDRRAELLTAVSELVSALAVHRRTMWTLGQQPDDPDARAAAHESRAAITAPLVRVGVLAPDLLAPAKQAERAVYAMRNPPDTDTLSRLREEALNASDHLVDQASRTFHQLDTLAHRTR
ncbi:protein kilB [Amycolatopsis panacis]|uniref:Protein kilB n=1 Tax=Amycolatopsis panacis TaxID=2340917 RepID=A0A419IBP4_9PSEU|nr:protein kilB [Amycolatopsis panacis]RJQ92388.1 protein kilB [Amycolatopsis panacis]